MFCALEDAHLWACQLNLCRSLCKTDHSFHSVAGIKVDKGLVPLTNSNGESWCQGLDGLAQRTAEYYKQGARFAKWRSVISIPAGPSKIALQDCAYGLARYAAIAQVHLVQSAGWLLTTLLSEFACCMPRHDTLAVEYVGVQWLAQHITCLPCPLAEA